MAWFYLIAAGLSEVWWAVALKKTEGWSNPFWSVVAVTGMVVSFQLLAMALKTLPISTAYAIWVGIGAAGVGIVGIVFFGEGVSVPKLLFLGMIIVGAVGLKLAA